MHTDGRLAIPLLQRHLNFVIDRYEKYHGSDNELKPAELGDMFSEHWTRGAIARIVERGQNHLTQVCFSRPCVIEMISYSYRVACSGMCGATGNWSDFLKKRVLRGMWCFR